MTGATPGGPAVIGRAETSGTGLPLGAEDPVEACRAVRRALADGRRKAIDVDRLVVATANPVSDEALRSFARRALGPAGESIAVTSLVGAGPADALSTLASAALRFEEAQMSTAIAVGLDANGTTVALCVEPRGAEASLG